MAIETSRIVEPPEARDDSELERLRLVSALRMDRKFQNSSPTACAKLENAVEENPNPRLKLCGGLGVHLANTGTCTRPSTPAVTVKSSPLEQTAVIGEAG